MATFTQADIDRIRKELYSDSGEAFNWARGFLSDKAEGDSGLKTHIVDQELAALLGKEKPSTFATPDQIAAAYSGGSAPNLGVDYQTWSQNPYQYMHGRQPEDIYQDYGRVMDNMAQFDAQLANPQASGWTPKTGNIPTYEQWTAGNPTIRGDNNPQYEYLNQFYNAPVHEGDFFETVAGMLPAAFITAATGGAFGPATLAEVMGGGTLAGALPTFAQGGSLWSDLGNLTGINNLFQSGSGSENLIGNSADDLLLDPQAIDGSMQTIYDASANAGLPGYDPSLVSGAAATLGGAGALANAAQNATQQEIDGSQQTIYNDNAGAGMPDYDPSLVPGAPSGSWWPAGTPDWLKSIPSNVWGGLAQGGLGYLGADKMADAYQNIYNQQSAIGAPYRDRLNASYQPGFSMMNDPGYADALNNSTNTFLRAASAGRAPGVSGGNPMDNPGAWAETMKYVNSSLALPALQTYRGQLGQFGGMGLNTAGQASLMNAQAQGGGLNAIGYGLNTAFQQPSAFDDYYRAAARRMNSGAVLP